MTPRVGILLAGLAGMIGCSDESSPARDAAARGDAAGMDGAGMDAALDCRLVCDDRIDCTDDSCAADACLHRPTAAACPAGSSCDPRMGCTAGRPCAADADCRDEDPCTTNERCDRSTRVCVFGILDGDGDGFGPPVCGGADCDDNNADLRPDGPESCNGLDDNCNDVVDEDTGMVCGEGESCVRGECVCAPGFTECFGHCVDLQTDGYHCGDCGANCGAGTCTAGVCVCGAGQTMCSFGCADLETSSASCGACGRRCPPGVDCVGGECQCPAGMSPCGDRCVDLESDLFNCGFCGRGCRDFRPSEECRGGECVVCGEPGTPCCRPSFIERAECLGSTCDADGICSPCGRLGQLCCGSARSCTEGTCGADGRCSADWADAGVDGSVTPSATSRIERSCSPSDGPALTLTVAGGSPCEPDTAAEHLVFFLYGGLPIEAPETITLGTGTGVAQRCTDADAMACEAASGGTITFDSFTDGAAAAGRFAIDVGAEHLEGFFSAVFCGDPPLCG